MIVRHRLVEAERVKELPLTLVAPPHHRPPPSRIAPGRRNHSSTPAFNAFLQQNLPVADLTLRAVVNARVAWSQVGIDLATNAPTPEALRQAVRTVLDTPDYRARAALMGE